MDFGTNLERLRKLAGKTQRKLREDAGVEESTISNLENGNSVNPGLQTLRKIAEKGLDVEVAALFVGPKGELVKLPGPKAKKKASGSG